MGGSVPHLQFIFFVFKVAAIKESTPLGSSEMNFETQLLFVGSYTSSESCGDISRDISSTYYLYHIKFLGRNGI